MIFRFPRAARLAAGLLISLVLGTVAPPVGWADQTDPRLDRLFGELQRTTGDREIAILEAAIWRIWLETGSATVDLLMQRGLDGMAAAEYDQAEAAFTKVTELAPDFAEAWNKRATVRYLAGEYEGAISDVERTLELEPRHFGALSGLAMVHHEMGDDVAALAAIRRTLEVHPHLEALIALEEKLTLQIEGRGI